MDRRFLRSERLLTGAMLTLISEKPFQEITVEEIVNKADVARKTFYAHFKNKHELLWHSLTTHFQTIESQLEPLNPTTLLASNKPLSYSIFKHVGDYAIFYQSMLQGDGNSHFVFQFLEYVAHQSFMRMAPLRENAPMATVPPELVADMLSGALLGALRWWLKNGMGDTPEQMAYRFSQIIAPGVLQSMGLDLID